MGALLAALVAALGPVVSALLQAWAAAAARPTTAQEIIATPEEAATEQKALAAARGFSGVAIPAVLALLLPFLAGCSLSDRPTVIMPHPAIPVRLAAPLTGVQVLVKQPTGDWILCTADLFAGELIMADPEDFPVTALVGQQQIQRVGPAPKP